MQETFKEILKELKNELNKVQSKCKSIAIKDGRSLDYEFYGGKSEAYTKAIEIVEQAAAADYNGGWIPCNKKMPPVETEVFILAKRKSNNGDCRYIRTTAMYEDGTVLENDSCWHWEDIEGEWDEENDCYIIPEGWWENRHYNPDDVYNNAVDDEVVAWQPLPAPY